MEDNLFHYNLRDFLFLQSFVMLSCLFFFPLLFPISQPYLEAYVQGLIHICISSIAFVNILRHLYVCMYDGLISKLLYIQSDNGNKTWPLKESVTSLYLRGDIEYRNRFKGLDLIHSVPDELWTEVHDILQETGIKTISMEKKCKKAKWLSDRKSTRLNSSHL